MASTNRAVDATVHNQPNSRKAPLCTRLVAALTGDTAVLDTYGGVTAALKRAVELQPAAEGRSFQVVIEGEHTWQSQRLLEARFGSV